VPHDCSDEESTKTIAAEHAMKFLITGCNGLIGSEAVEYFGREGEIVGIDNNMRREFFGPAADTVWNLERLRKTVRNFRHYDCDIRDLTQLETIYRAHSPFDAVIHCAAQPSHDKACEFPLLDFGVNAVGTVNMLETTRKLSADAVFIFTSTNKVYGDAPNEVPLQELETRYEYSREEDYEGIDEDCRIDRSTHSVFGASKIAADVMVQEYGRYFGVKTCILRGGCLTGPAHSGVKLHGFLSYLVKVAVAGEPYTVIGYKGKQVRDNIHSYDVIRAMEEVIRSPRCGEVYNMGGGRSNSVSILEAITRIETLTGKKISWDCREAARVGDHICYISDLSKFSAHYPKWKITKNLDEILIELIQAETDKLKS
jgi:CDP-paratose 2-epimerase